MLMIKKKKLSLSIGIASVVLALLWVSLIITGTLTESDRIRMKETSGQKASYFLTEVTPSPILVKNHVCLIIDDSLGELQVDKVMNLLPEGATFGLSPYNKAIHKNIALLTENKRSFLVNIPLSIKKNNAKKLDLLPNLGDKEIINRIESIQNMTQGNIGFYNLGNDDFLKKEKALEATVKKIYDLDSILFYGIKNRTSTLESEDGSSFKIKSFDLEITDDNVEQGLKFLEEVALKTGEAIGVLKINDRNIGTVSSWYNSLKEKNIDIVPATTLFDRGN